MASHVLWILLFIFQVISIECDQYQQQYKSDGFIDRLSNGMKFAKDFLGSESVAQKVAEFVVRAFQTAKSSNTNVNRRRPPSLTDAYVDESSQSGEDENSSYSDVNEAPNPMTPLRHLVRLFGLQPTQISAVAVNALVFVAQMISTFLAGPKRPSEPYRSDDPTSWILNKKSRKLQDIITMAKNESLPNIIEQVVKEQDSEEDSSCIQLLVCKITPFVSKMQKAVFGEDHFVDRGELKNVRGSAVMYRHLPSAGEINDRNDICEKRHKECDLNE